jgi:CheY-like chemotaxis protein
MNSVTASFRQILVADDDPATRMILYRALSKAGFRVMLASDGARAFAMLEDNPDIALVITDILMPNMDGRQLIAALAADRRFEKLPRIIMSATVSIKEITSLLQMGASRFLAKPINPKLLEWELTALLG